MRSIFRAVKSLLERTRFEREMRDEIRFHVERRADDLVAAGVPRDEALRRARLEFGAVEAWKERCRDASGFASVRFFHGLATDLRRGVRRLLATPVFTLFAIASLGLGVGVTTGVYSVVDRLFWKALLVEDPERLMLMLDAERGPYEVRWVMSDHDFEDLRDSQRSFSQLSRLEIVFPGLATATSTELTPAEAVDEHYFRTIGVSPAMGRAIQEPDVRSSDAVVILSHTLWRTRFAADPQIVGRSVRLGGRPFEVIGVAPREFEGVIPGPRGAQLWVPLSVADSLAARRSATVPVREMRRLTVVGRLRPDVSSGQAETEVLAVSERLDASRPRPKRSDNGIPVRRGWSLKSIVDANRNYEMTRFGMLIVALVALVLVVACTNLANLVLARGTMRHQEVAVRGALGASRWRLVREQLAESMILAAAGGIAAVLVLMALTRWLDTTIPLAASFNMSLQPEINVPVLVASAVAVLLALVVFGLEPALALTRRSDVRTELALTSGAVGVPKAKRQRRLLRWQVAISAGFFIIASMCVRSVILEARHDPGVELDGLAIAGISFYSQGWDEARATSTIDRLHAALARTPGLSAAAISSGLPFGSTITPYARLSTPDEPILKDHRIGANLVAATPGYLQAAGTRLLRGRALDQRDTVNGPRVIMLSESAAKEVFGTTDAVGRQVLMQVNSRGFRTTEPIVTATVVGITEDSDTTHFFLRRGGIAYAPLAQEYFPTLNILGRGESSRAALAAMLSAIRATEPDLAISNNGSARQMLTGPYAMLRGLGIVAVTLGALTLLLAMGGLYGVQSHIVAHRTREIGVRMSLGATASQIRRMVLGDGYRPVLQGLAIGMFIGFVGRAIVRSMLFERMTLIDPWMFTLVPVPLILAAFCACYLPARRAARVDPNVALRHL